MTKLLQNIFSIGNVNYHKVITIMGIKIKFKTNTNYFKQNKDKYEMFYKRNLMRNALISIRPVRNEKVKKIPFLWKEEFIALNLFKEKINFFLFNKINIPQIEFTLTTKCTLRCKDCANYIPCVNKDEHIQTDLKDYKEDIDNLCSAVNKIYNLFLLGGEPLLIKDFHKYIEYSANKKQIKKVWVFTNGTMLFNEELLNTIKKYRKKVIIYLSDYSSNPELKDKLKHEKIIEQINQTKAELVYDKSLLWYITSNICDKYRENKESIIAYYKKCLLPCVSVCKDIIFPCPRAGVFYLKNLYQFDETIGGGEFVSLKNSNSKQLKKEIFEFYCNNYYRVCNLCTILEDKKQPRILPAVQIKD